METIRVICVFVHCVLLGPVFFSLFFTYYLFQFIFQKLLSVCMRFMFQIQFPPSFFSAECVCFTSCYGHMFHHREYKKKTPLIMPLPFLLWVFFWNALVEFCLDYRFSASDDLGICAKTFELPSQWKLLWKGTCTFKVCYVKRAYVKCFA